jgi:SAM-dependent methyltransferase
MNKELKNYYLDQLFRPSFVGIFINPLYFIRNGLYKGILSNKKYLDGKMLDFGCGTKPYKDIIDVREYIGLEIEGIDEAHKNEQIDVYYDGITLPFQDDHFDSVFSSEVFEHVFNLEQILKELNRVLKPGGTLLITLPFVWYEHSVPFDFARYTSFGIIHLLKKNGFAIIVSEKTTNYVETAFQMWTAYIYQYVFPSNKVIKVILTPFFIAPLTILGIFLSKILPRNKDFYHNNIIVARKQSGNISI